MSLIQHNFSPTPKKFITPAGGNVRISIKEQYEMKKIAFLNAITYVDFTDLKNCIVCIIC